MCGIVGAIAKRDVTALLLDGLKRLEYRGYDSAGIAVIDAKGGLQRTRRAGKISALESALSENPHPGNIGIAHTRWATHGKPSEKNAHPFASREQFAVVHNGIIENHALLKQELLAAGYEFSSDTDSEVIVHLLHFYHEETNDFLMTVQKTVSRLEGAFALAILNTKDPDKIIAVRHGSPLVIGKSAGENFVASDPMALLPLTREFVYLEENDIAILDISGVSILNGTEKNGKPVSRSVHVLTEQSDFTDRGEHRHFMRQEIFSQPRAILSCLSGSFPEKIPGLNNISHICFIACGTSYHAALVARYWLEEIAGIACSVEIASEYRYRNAVIPENTLAVFISQSGETADTLAALRLVKEKTATLAICNVAESSLVREADSHFLTRAGAEIGVASTKAFTTQLVALLRLAFEISGQTQKMLPQLLQLPDIIRETLTLDEKIRLLASQFTTKHHALFMARDSLFPIALEGALKLKEISYIHAEGYPAGELKHGPLALVDPDMPVIALAPNNTLFAKICSGLQEVSARGGRLYVLTDNPKAITTMDKNIEVIAVPKTDPLLAPIVYTIPLQLLAYHVAVLKGTDVDQPRNLAKSVTVE